MKYHGDNAAMVGSQGYYEFLNGNRASLNLNARACELLTQIYNLFISFINL